jgi:hypothetical protein
MTCYLLCTGISSHWHSSWFMTKSCLGAGGQHFETTMKQDRLTCRRSMDFKFPTDDLYAVKSSNLHFKCSFELT